MCGKQESVLIQLREGARETIQNNTQKLCSITEIIISCGWQNITLRGNCDSGSDMEGVQAASTNHGNFCALLNFRISAGDTILGDHFQGTARNATYTSPNIQNQLISILGEHICNAILRKVRSNLCYTLIADEVTDCSNKEQLCNVIRYVELKTASIREDLFNVTVALLAKHWLTRCLVSSEITYIQQRCMVKPITELVICPERQTELQLEYFLCNPSPFTPIALLTV